MSSPLGNTDFKLVPELVPEPLWKVSAQMLLRRAAWGRIRSAVLKEANGACAVCTRRQDKGMVCHELWHYDEEAAVATLTGFAILCPDCNFAEHFGLAGAIGQSDRSLDHLASVNAISREEAQRVRDRAMQTFLQRSRLAWTVQIAAPLKAEYPELSVLEGIHRKPGAGGKAVRDQLGR